MERLMLFFFDGICGYYFQAIGYLLMICAANRLSPKKKVFFGVSVLYGLLTFVIRSITIISTGFHTMLIITCFIFLSVFLLRTKIFPTVVGVLSTTLIILMLEILVVGISALFYDSFVFKSDGTVQGDIRKALFGIPVNILLILLSFLLYKKRLKYKRKGPDDDGSTGE